MLGTIGNGAHGWNGRYEDRNVSAESVAVPFDGYDLPPVKAVACAQAKACVITRAGGVWCWGTDGAIPEDIVDAPRERKFPRPVTQLSLGKHSCAVVKDKSLWCWGANASGQLGLGTLTDEPQPRRVEALAGVSAVAVSDRATCAVDVAKTLWCWGSNQVYELLDEGPDQTKPWRTSMRDVEEIAAGPSHFCARTAQGEITCWGNNFEKRLGVENIQGRQGPTGPAVGAKAAKPFSMALGAESTSVLTVDGNIVSWGGNSVGQLGSPQRMATSVGVTSKLERVVEIAASNMHVCALKADESVWCWGAGQDDQLGNGRAENSSVPVRVVFRARSE